MMNQRGSQAVLKRLGLRHMPRTRWRIAEVRWIDREGTEQPFVCTYCSIDTVVVIQHAHKVALPIAQSPKPIPPV